MITGNDSVSALENSDVRIHPVPDASSTGRTVVNIFRDVIAGHRAIHQAQTSAVPDAPAAPVTPVSTDSRVHEDRIADVVHAASRRVGIGVKGQITANQGIGDEQGATVPNAAALDGPVVADGAVPQYDDATVIIKPAKTGGKPRMSGHDRIIHGQAAAVVDGTAATIICDRALVQIHGPVILDAIVIICNLVASENAATDSHRAGVVDGTWAGVKLRSDKRVEQCEAAKICHGGLNR